MFRNELTACLALVVPVGMTEAGRREWLAVAWETVGHLPPDLLQIGCKKARETADHPSKIVPTILFEVRDMMKWRREEMRVPLLEVKPCTPDQAERILDAEGILDSVRASIKRVGPPPPRRKPTRQDYIEMGVDPAVLDSTYGIHTSGGG